MLHCCRAHIANVLDRVLRIGSDEEAQQHVGILDQEGLKGSWTKINPSLRPASLMNRTLTLFILLFDSSSQIC